MAGGKSTIGTVLKCGAMESNLTKLCKIKSYPQLGGERENIESTDLEDEAQTFVPGVQQVESMQFGANYDLETYKTIKESANKEQFYQLEFGKDGADGKFKWKGMHDVYINEGEVNGLRGMTISIIPSTAVEPVSAS